MTTWSSAWPTKNATNEVMSETISATTANTISLAAKTEPRRGIEVSEVRIIPVEYSAVMTIAPSTIKTSDPSSVNAVCDRRVASKPAGAPPEAAIEESPVRDDNSAGAEGYGLAAESAPQPGPATWQPAPVRAASQAPAAARQHMDLDAVAHKVL